MTKVLFMGSFLLFASVYVLADETIGGLLKTIEKTSDLSEKTKLENSGFSTIYTRNDLDMMQVKYLRDVLKYSFDGYSDSRYGLPDPLSFGYLPFTSSLVRVFIDDQELTTAMYGSGMITVGNLELSFVDHIEIYNLSTSFVYSTEPTMTLIRLFSKKAERDEGGSIKGQVTSKKGSTQNIQYIGKEQGIDYLVRFSRDDDERDTYSTSQEDLNRDVNRYNFFASLTDETQSLLINASKTKGGGWIGPSFDASLDTAKMSYEDLHVGYTKQNNTLKFTLTYDALKDHVLYEDNPLAIYNLTPITRFESKANNSVITTELKYTSQFDRHALVAGAKYRYKTFSFDRLQMNGVDLVLSGHTKQEVGTAFVEDSYALSDNFVATLGLQASHVKNNGPYHNDTVKMARAGITYTNNRWTTKSFIIHSENYLDPYLIGSIFTEDSFPESQVLDVFAQEFKYEKGNSLYEYFISYGFLKNMPYINNNLRMDTADKSSGYINTFLKYTYAYDNIDKLSLTYQYRSIDHKGYEAKISNHQIILRNQHRYHKFDFFEEMMITHSEYFSTTGYDLTLGARYNVNDRLILTCKGQNLLGHAEKEYYPRVDVIGMNVLSQLSVPIQERKIMVGFEWLF